jgi:signal transduction histidine kinase
MNLAAGRDMEGGVLAGRDDAAEKSRFLALFSHELRTPLNAIIGFADLVASRPEDGRCADWAGHIRLAGEHLLELVNNVIELARSGGEVGVEPAPVDLVELCRSTLSLICPLAGSNRNELVLDCPPDIGLLVTDGLKLKQCLINLLGNACKFTADGRVALVVRVHSDPAPAWIELAVEDTGIGIADEHRARLARLFSEAGASIERRIGSGGIGLSLTAEMARLLGGRVDLRTAPGQGSVFSLFLPAHNGLWRPAASRRPAPPELAAHA